MLILTRRVGETLVIGDDVTVTVLGVRGNQVRLGVNAPKDIAVHREKSISAFKMKKMHQIPLKLLKMVRSTFDFSVNVISCRR